MNKVLLRKIRKIKDKHSETFMKKHNLTGFGIGFKKVKGKKTNKLSLVFMVEKKLSKSKLSPDQLLPSILDGTECDVIETGKIVASMYTDRVRPAIPGYSVGHYAVTAGTLGCVVYRGTTKYILSNNHILANTNDAEIGDHIWQPGRIDGGTDTDTIAILTDWIPIVDWVTVDCAIAEIVDDSLITTIGVWGGEITSYSDPEVGNTVFKSGRTTELTEDTVEYEHTSVNCEYPSLGTKLINDIFVTGLMTAGGDSGSVTRSSDSNAVGLTFANGASFTYHCYMSNVVSALSISFVPGIPRGYIWVEGNYLSFTNMALYQILGTNLGYVVAEPGHIWIDTLNDLYYIDSSSNKRRVPWKTQQDFIGTDKKGMIWIEGAYIAYIGNNGYKYICGM